MLRGLLIVLLLANALFFVWTRGWLAPGFPAPHAGEREPARLAAQQRPEAIVVLPGTAASAAISAARAASLLCLEAGPLQEAQLAAAEAAVGGAGLPAGSWQREAAPAPLLWLVFAGRAADAAGLRLRADELKRLNLDFEVLDNPPELANGFGLTRHASKAEAEAALATYAATGLRGARVVQLPAPPAQWLLRVSRADAELQDKLRALPPDALAGGFKPCTGAASVATAASGAGPASSAASASSGSAATATPAASAAASAAPVAAATASAAARPASR